MSDLIPSPRSDDMENFVANKTFLEHIFNSIREGIIVIDKRLKIKYRNMAATRLLGIPEETSRLSVASFLKGIDWKSLIVQNGCSQRRELEILYPERRIIRFYVVPHGTAGFATVILDDITEEYDRAVSQAENERSKLISMLAAGVAHEIGNPLNSIYLNLQLLQRMFAREPMNMAEAAESIDECKKEVERLDSIINQFLKALRPAKLNFQPTEICEIIHETLGFMRHEIADRSVEVLCDTNPSLPRIPADAGQLKQAFYNLFKNAVQSMPHGGKLLIACSEDDDHIRVEISDTGKGISPENITKIFNPYYTTKATGNGLGLMIVERIVREHGGKLSIETVEDKGTTFILRFPIHPSRIRILPPAADPIAGILPAANNQEHKE